MDVIQDKMKAVRLSTTVSDKHTHELTVQFPQAKKQVDGLTAAIAEKRGANVDVEEPCLPTVLC
jgi:hypothetical protein